MIFTRSSTGEGLQKATKGAKTEGNKTGRELAQKLNLRQRRRHHPQVNGDINFLAQFSPLPSPPTTPTIQNDVALPL